MEGPRRPNCHVSHPNRATRHYYTALNATTTNTSVKNKDRKYTESSSNITLKFVIRRKNYPPLLPQRCEIGDGSTLCTLVLALPPPPPTGPAAAVDAGCGAEVILINEEDARIPQSLGAISPHLTCARRPQSSHSSTALRPSRFVQISHFAPPPGSSPLAKKK